MKHYAVLKIKSDKLDSFLDGSDQAALMIDETFETSWEAQEYINSRQKNSLVSYFIRKEVPDYFYLIWFVAETEIARFSYNEDEGDEEEES